MVSNLSNKKGINSSTILRPLRLVCMRQFFRLLKLIISLFTLIQLIGTEKIYCQESTPNLRINASKITHLFYLNGIFFEPINKLSNQADSIGCKNQEEEFYLNGLRINKGQFMKLNLTHKDLRNDSTSFFSRRDNKLGYGTYEYHFAEGQVCSNKIIYRMEVKLPFFLNGKEVNQEVLTNIESFEIKRESCFLCVDEIHIQTK